jgi:hypothetical protein
MLLQVTLQKPLKSVSNKIYINSPSSYEQEKRYIFNVIFKEFLGLDYEVNFCDDTSYTISFYSSKKIVFKDSFFKDNESTYLHEKNIPQDITYGYNQFIEEKDIPILFGSNELTENKDTIDCGIDIFASIFFMLSRWEEYVVKERDQHNRFSAYSSVAYKNNFLNRPIVNEYLEMLWNMMIFLGYSGARKKHTFKWVVTHDVDYLKKWTSIKQLFRSLVGDIYKRRSPSQAFSSIISYLTTRLKISNDPFDTFDFLMTISENKGLKSYFFFMSGGQTNYDNKYDINEAVDLINQIKKRGHYIGIHPSYNAYSDSTILSSEIKKLEHVSGQKISFGREHFLRYEVPLTARLWEENNLHWDSSLSYADEPGFRCGVCYDFSIFDFIKSKTLNLKEKPLILMEATLLDYKKHNNSKIIDTFSYFEDKVKKYNGNFIFLWHNSSFNIGPYKKCKTLYKTIFE